MPISLHFSVPSYALIVILKLPRSSFTHATFNLNDGSYRAYRKPNCKTHYIHIQSNHQPSITKQLSRSVEKCLSQLSSSKHIFYEATPFYGQRLTSCGYNEKLNYQQQGENIENNKNIGKN